jgi:mono/diheme cytochrome c family protein
LFDALKKSTGRRDISYDLSTYNPTSNNTEGDKMPNLSQILTDAQIWDIVKYLKTEALDVTQLYDATYTGTYPTGTATYSNVGKDGNAEAGKTYYAQKCASCHGVNGKALLMENMSAGEFTRKKPYEVQHKVKFGQLGSSMTATTGITLQDMKNLYKALADTVAFPR